MKCKNDSGSIFARPHHGDASTDGLCAQCLERRRKKADKKRRRWQNTPLGTCRKCGRDAGDGRRICPNCTALACDRRNDNGSAYRRTYVRLNYTPIDEWLARPRNRILRIVRRFDWISAEDIGDMMGVPTRRESGKARDSLGSMIRRLKLAGLLEQRFDGSTYEYRLARNVPLSELEPPIDNEVIGDEQQECA